MVDLDYLSGSSAVRPGTERGDVGRRRRLSRPASPSAKSSICAAKDYGLVHRSAGQAGGEPGRAGGSVGDDAMNWLPLHFDFGRGLCRRLFGRRFDGFCATVLGAQIDLLPALMVYAGLTHGFTTIVLLAVCGGLWFDSLSLNPLGVSVLPAVGDRAADLSGPRPALARTSSSPKSCWARRPERAATAGGTLFILLNTGVAAAAGLDFALAVAGHGGGRRGVSRRSVFKLFDRLHRAFDYQPVPASSFRPDREIKRGRV